LLHPAINTARGNANNHSFLLNSHCMCIPFQCEKHHVP
jgi:hypothetical protein